MDPSAVPVDLDRPVEIAPRVWWVGGQLDNDPFQCHAYLIEHGENSVLFDPGSALTYPIVRKKVAEIVPLTHVRYVVLHHQDPDIAGALAQVIDDVDAASTEVVTHWRVHTFIKHHDVDAGYYLIEDNDWTLDLGGRVLRFIFTPYAHFPGAFCTFDESSGTLFSSDLFGGFTESLQLFAKDESYFEQMRPFHEHYIPSREILLYALSEIARYPVRMIAPQHGSIIPEPLVAPMIEKLSQLDCGLYLLAQGNTDIRRLSRLNEALHDITSTMMLRRSFDEIGSALLAIAQRIVPARSLTIFHSLNSDNVLVFAEARRFGVTTEPCPAEVAEILALDRTKWLEQNETTFAIGPDPSNSGDENRIALVLPLFDPDRGLVTSLAVFPLDHRFERGPDLGLLAEQLGVALQVAVEREVLYQQAELERQRFYHRSIRDSLTGLFTRFYMNDAVGRLLKLHDRDARAKVALAMFDVDHFKRINDTFGHSEGDRVLTQVAEILHNSVRESDIPVRFGGEEFAVFLVGSSSTRAPLVAERIRELIEQYTFDGSLEGHKVTISAGVVMHSQDESLHSLIQRADEALYAAKNAGRNRVESRGWDEDAPTD